MNIFRNIAYLLAFGIPFLVSSQEVSKVYMDSVLSRIKTQPEKIQKKSYQELGILLNKTRPEEKASQFYEYLFKKDSSEIMKLNIYQFYWRNLSRTGKLDKAIEICKKGIALSEKYNDERFLIHYNSSIATCYHYKNKAEEALYHLNEAERLALDGTNGDMLRHVYYTKGLVYILLKDYKKAEESYLKMWEVVKNYENSATKRFVVYVLVDYFSQVDRPNELVHYTEILSELYEDANPDMPSGHMPIKDIFKKSLDPEKIPILQEAIRVSDSMNSMNSLLQTTLALTNIYNELGQSAKAIPYLKRMEIKLDSIHKPFNLKDTYQALSYTSAKAKNYQDAYTYRILQASLEDSIISENTKRNIAKLEIEFETEKKERQIAEQKLELEQKERQRKMIQYGLIALGVLLVLSLFFFRYRLKSQHTISTQNEAIQKQKITDLQQKNKLLAMSSMIEGQEAERLRIAKDLHDSLGGLLSTVKAHFTAIQNEIKQLEALNITEKTNHLIDEACVEVRRISHNMMPHALSIAGLQGAIEDAGAHLNSQGYNTTVEIKNLPRRLSETREVMIYRLIQEILSNIRKHAKAKSILIQLLGHEDLINLIVEDDGKGFVYETAVMKGGLGLKSINSRVQFLDGTIDWDTSPGNGTLITITIPVE
ncbi:histidine kinase [Jejudonia soesokkakensis]|uniref:histidine kinase n=1 Tax=Jejudonia soesokkakensis TaxID=1323432 RepID=A0ABW2MXK0_9FLAO